MVTGDRPSPEFGNRRAPWWLAHGAALVSVALVTVALRALAPWFPLGEFPVSYFLLTMVVAYYFGGGPAAVAAVLGWAAFTYVLAPHDKPWPPAVTPKDWARQAAYLMGTTLVAVAAASVSRANRRVRQLADEAIALNQTLREQIAEREAAEQALKELNAELDQRVAERTAQLENANKELEAFSYSVSHDLRAPLRAIDGFSNTLLKNYGDALDERAQDYLRRVRAASQRMAQLIDDILGLSRATRAEMHRQRVDLSEMASEILDSLRRSEPRRRAELVVQPGVIVDADAPLLHIALDNLLRNAWKFTGKREVARIEVGSLEQDGERVYFVRDNGVGFSMNYADKLFSPFQRLHTESDFPGTGIGLALVQRIVRRHGGRIWVHSEIDQGTTFYFTLGETDG